MHMQIDMQNDLQGPAGGRATAPDGMPADGL